MDERISALLERLEEARHQLLLQKIELLAPEPENLSQVAAALRAISAGLAEDAFNVQKLFAELTDTQLAAEAAEAQAAAFDEESSPDLDG